MPCGTRALRGLEIDREITEDSHGQFVDLEPELSGHVVNEEAVHAHLVRRDDGIADAEVRIAREEGIKVVPVSRVVVEGRRELEVHVLGEVELRSHLPAEHKRVVFRKPAPTAY